VLENKERGLKNEAKTNPKYATFESQMRALNAKIELSGIRQGPFGDSNGGTRLDSEMRESDKRAATRLADCVALAHARRLPGSQKA